ncbi:uncharacterized protein LOC121262118 [Juglans microcarpa x Juglans regia]|uniref:uncharacterized protein LOC121262118 n=1 Tax=Juglans microcarpa x Juglans regia TaxID=2249226 RepID=UPI001B7DF8D4|nr:uncharacterized protein LOC121262118 [Juglans microcarpa x Juglans regia]
MYIKRKHHVKKTTFLTEQVSALIAQRIPPKYNDSSCPTIVCSIENHEFGQALLDLGVSVNVMSSSIYLQLGLGKIKPTTVDLQLVDHSVKVPRGVVEDVLIQIDKFYYPVDFLIPDTSSVVDTTKIPLILDRPFLAAANTLINCKNELMKRSFGNKTLEVNIFHIAKQPEDDDESHQTYMINSLMDRGVFIAHDFDPHEYFLVNSEFDSINDPYDQGTSPHRDPQRKLNPIMKEMVKNEVLKLLDAGIVYSIADSKWEFDITIKDKKGVENVVADHLSRLIFEDTSGNLQIRDDFPNEHLLSITSLPWFAYIVNYLAAGEIPVDWSA